MQKSFSCNSGCSIVLIVVAVLVIVDGAVVANFLSVKQGKKERRRRQCVAVFKRKGRVCVCMGERGEGGGCEKEYVYIGNVCVRNRDREIGVGCMSNAFGYSIFAVIS